MTAKKCTKKCDASAKLLFWLFSLLLFWRPRFSRRRRILSSLLPHFRDCAIIIRRGAQKWASKGKLLCSANPLAPPLAKAELVQPPFWSLDNFYYPPSPNTKYNVTVEVEKLENRFFICCPTILLVIKVKDDHRSFIRNFCSCKKKAGRKFRAFFFSFFLFATAKVAYITEMIILHLILRSVVHIYDFQIIQLCLCRKVSPRRVQAKPPW